MAKKFSSRLKDKDVYEMLVTIPKGKISTYGDIAKALGCPGGSRAVGRILNKNPNPIVVPCHRVVMSDGSIGGYANGTERKKELLEREGIIFADDSVKDFMKRRAVLIRR